MAFNIHVYIFCIFEIIFIWSFVSAGQNYYRNFEINIKFVKKILTFTLLKNKRHKKSNAIFLSTKHCHIKTSQAQSTLVQYESHVTYLRYLPVRALQSPVLGGVARRLTLAVSTDHGQEPTHRSTALTGTLAKGDTALQIYVIQWLLDD